METQEAVENISERAGIVSQDKKKNPYNKLFYKTNHLPNFEKFNELIDLQGDQYACLKKARYYQLLGGILQKKITFGGVDTDTRVQVLYPLPTEAGKNSIIYAIKFLIKKGISKNEQELFTISEPISYSAESLVGKYVERMIDNPAFLDGEVKQPKKIKDKILNKGHFDSDFLELDECTRLIMSKDEQVIQAREYFSKSENAIGMNEVEKRLVDDLITETVAYPPENTNSFYFQPAEKIPENIMTQGFMRRKIIPIGDISKFLVEGNRELISRKVATREVSKDKIGDEVIKFLETMKRNTQLFGEETSYVFTEEARELIIDYVTTILRQGKLHSEKIANFCKINKYTTTEYLLKMACILASAHGKNVVDKNFVALAFMDLTEFMQNTYDFVYSFVKGNFDYGVKWKGAKYYDIECLKFLHSNDCLSFDSSTISVDDFLSEVTKVYPNDIGKETARKHMKRMKDEDWIKSSQKGQYDSRVWLTFNPKVQETIDEANQGSKGWKVYQSIVLGINELLTGTPPLPSSTPSIEKVEVKDE